MFNEDGRPYFMKWWYMQFCDWRTARRPQTRYNVAKTERELEKAPPPPRGVMSHLKACKFCGQDPPDHYGTDCPNYRRKPCRYCGMVNPDHKGPECAQYIRMTCRHCGMTNPDHKGPDCKENPKVIKRNRESAIKKRKQRQSVELDDLDRMVSQG